MIPARLVRTLIALAVALLVTLVLAPAAPRSRRRR
jgi:hypothetical protein